MMVASNCAPWGSTSEVPVRIVEVAPERFDRWRARFEANNPQPDPAQRILRVERFDHEPMVLLLIRRGGFAVGLVRGGVLSAHKVGTRYVQSRTAAGGWSQQRYARRRTGQAEELVEVTAGHLSRIVGGAVGIAGLGADAGLVLGGDRRLTELALAEPGVAAMADLPTRTLYDLPDPRRDILDRAVARSSAVRVTIEEEQRPGAG